MIDHAILETGADEVVLDVNIKARVGKFELEARITAPGGLTALFGRSGAGKTTLVNLLAGLDRPISGRIRVGDVVLFDAARGIDLPPERRRVGYVFQEARLFPHLSVRGNLAYGMNRVPVAERRHGFDQVVELLELGPLLERRPTGLSGGEKQRVAIGRALLSQPRLLLMDEPLASLDEMRKGEILPYLERLRDELKLPILYVSHSIDEVLRLSSAVAAVADGTVIACGPLADVLSRPDLLPVIGRFDVGTILECTVTAHDETFQLSTVSFADGELRVPLVGSPVGAAARVRVRSRDVSLALSRPMDVSVTNRLAGTITRITRAEGPFADVEVSLPHSKLTSLVTQESVERLALEPGMTVWAMIKAVTVDSRPAGFSSPGAEILSPPLPASPEPQAQPHPVLRVIPAEIHREGRCELVHRRARGLRRLPLARPVERDHALAEGGHLRAGAAPAGKGDDHLLLEHAVEFVHEQPGAAVAHADGLRRRQDRAVDADRFQEGDLARPQPSPVREIDAQEQAGVFCHGGALLNPGA